MKSENLQSLVNFFDLIAKEKYLEAKQVYEECRSELERTFKSKQGERYFSGLSVETKTRYLLFKVFDVD